MTHTLYRLEQALGMWEETCLAFSSLAQIQVARNIPMHERVPHEGPFVHWNSFRRYLLDSMRDTTFDSDRFIGPVSVVETLKVSGSALAFLPQALASWTRHSRRIYRVTEELQHLLHLVSLKGVTWGDVPWPFESFGMALDVPLFDGKGRGYDFILVSHEADPATKEPCIGVRLFSTDFGDYKPMSRDEKAKALQTLARKQWDKWDHMLSKRTDAAGEMTMAVFYLGSRQMQLPVTKTIASVTSISEDIKLDELWARRADLSHSHWDFAAKLVVGLCKYLRSLPKGTSHVSDWRRIDRKPSFDPHAVTNEAEVCSVNSVYHFSPEEWDMLRAARGSARAYYELCVHFREGHWRRLPGKGSDPTAPFDVIVRPTIVRLDRLLPGAVPRGLEKAVH